MAENLVTEDFDEQMKEYPTQYFFEKVAVCLGVLPYMLGLGMAMARISLHCQRYLSILKWY